MRNIIIALVGIPLTLILAIAIFGQFSTNVDRTSWSAAANTSYTTTVAQTWAGYNLAALLPYILIAVTIVGAVIGGLMIMGK
jgi:hypothetical protein